MRPHILIASLLLFMAVTPIAAALEAPSEHELAVLDYINEARRAPLEMAASMGMDPEQILKDFPELAHILIHGLPPLALDGRLYVSASAHTADMLENSYYSTASPDGSTPEDRMIAAGYVPEFHGETIGMLGFVNYIPPDQASRTLFETMFTNELDPDREGERNILNPDLREVGVSLTAGVFSISGNPWNVYLITCDYGTEHADLMVERILANLVNEARNNPSAVLEDLEIDKEDAASVLGDDAWLLTTGLPPLARDRRLNEAALRHNLDMLQNQYLASVTPDGVEPWERIENTGYEALFSSEALAMTISEDSSDPWATARALYLEIVTRELDGTAGERCVFNPDLDELGVGYTSTVFDAGEEGDRTLNLLVADFARPVEKRTFIIGRIFHDANGNLAPDPGEEAVGARVELWRSFDQQEQGATAVAVTDPAGGYQAPISPLIPHKLRVYDADGNLLYETILGAEGGNVWHDMPLETTETDE